MPEYEAPTLDKVLGGLGTGIGLGSTVAGALGTTAATGLMGATMAGLLTNPFTAPIAALLPFAAKMFGPGSDGPKMVGATNLVEPYDKLLTQRRDDFLKQAEGATPEQKLQFAAEQEAIIQDMFNNLNKYSDQLGDIGARSIAERQAGGKHDFYKYYVAPITGGSRASDFAQANGLQMPSITGTPGAGGAAGGLNLSQIPRFGQASGTEGSVPAGTLNLGSGGSALSTIAPMAAAGGAAMNFGNIGSWLGDLFGNKTFQNVLTSSLPAITGILGGLGSKSSNDTANQTLQTAITDLIGRGDQFANLSADQQAQLMSSINAMLGIGGATPEFTALQSDIANTGSNIPALFGQNLADPQALQMLLSSILDPRLQGSMDSASQLVQSGGMTPELQQLFQTAQAFQTGGSGQQMQLQDLANQLTADGGMTPFLQSLQGAGTSALNSKGMTPEIQQALAPFMSLLQSGGKTAENTSLFNKGMDLFSREALLPMSTAINIAGDQAGSAVQQQFEQARREAQVRGGGPGAVVGSGSANDARADYADQAARTIANAKQNAMMSQQGLQLQQQATGAGAAGNAAANMAQLLSTGQSGVGNLLGTAAQRESSLGGLGATAQQIGDSRTGMGGDFLNTIMQIALGGGNLAASGVGQQTGLYNAGQNAVQGLGSLQQGGFDKILQGLLQGSSQGIQQGQAMGNLMNSNQELLSRNELGRMDNINALLQLLSNTSTGNLNMAGDLYKSSTGLQAPLAQGQRNSPISDATTAVTPGLGQWIQTALKGLGGNSGTTTTIPFDGGYAGGQFNWN